MSSYELNNYGEILQAIAKSVNVGPMVELGVLDGYSAIHIGRALRENKRHTGYAGHLDAYDLWEDYEFKHGNKEEVQKRINHEGLMEFITLHKGNAYEVWNNYLDKTIYLLHVDISNTGDTVREIMRLWNPKMVHNGIILFEGGSEERDQVEWMTKFNKPSIRKEMNTNKIIDDFYVVGTYEKYPSLTFLYKKYDEEHMP